MLETILGQAADIARVDKEGQVRRARGLVGERELPFTVVTWRGDQAIAVGRTADCNRDDSLHLARMAAGGFDADSLVLVVDAYMRWDPKGAPDAGLNPLTGEEWAPGEMQHAVENHGALEKGWLRESLWLTAVNRAGDAMGLGLPYVVTKKHVEWDPPQTMSTEDGAVLMGHVPDTLRRIMRQPTFSSMINAWELKNGSFGIEEEERRATQDAMTVQFIAAQIPGAMVGVFVEAGGIRERVFRKCLPAGEIRRPPRPMHTVN